MTLAQIADRTGLNLADLQMLFADKADILAALGRMIDQETLRNLGEGALEGTVKDRLFEVLMARFDVLQDHRPGIVALLSDLLCDPLTLGVSLPHLGRSMVWMLEAAGVETTGWAGCARVVGLVAVYLKTLQVWKEDASPDLSATMAELDRALSLAGTFAARLGLETPSSVDRAGVDQD